MADDNPFLPSKLQTLGMMLSGLGSGISAASARNLPAYYGIAPGAQAFTNSYGNLLQRGAAYDLQNKNYELNKSYKDIQEQALQQSIEAQKQKLGFGKQLLDALGGGGAVGMRAPQKPLLGPDFSETPTDFNIGNVRPTGASTGFRTVPDFNSGVALTVNNARSYPAAFNNGQPMTIMQIGQHWAPYGDGSNDPKSWAFNVARGSGLDPNQPLDLNNPEIAAKFARGVHLAEKGKMLPLEAYLPGASGNSTSAASPTAGPPGVPQLPGPPPDTTRMQVLSSLAGYPGVGTALADRAKTLYGYDKFRYQAGMDQAKLQQQIHNGEVIQLPDGTWGPNPAFVAAEAAKAKAAGTDVDSQMALVDYKAVSKQNTDLQNSGMKARSRIADLDRLEQLGKGIDTGWGAEAMTTFKAMAKGMGLDITSFGFKDNTGRAQAYMALANQFALQQRDTSQGTGMPGAMSDNDVKILQSMIPSLSMTAEGRAYLTETMRRIAQRQVTMAKIASDFMRSPDAHKQPNALYDKLSAYADAHPIWSEDDLKKAQGLQSGAPPPPEGYTVQGGGGGGIPAPPAGFKVVQ